MRKVFVVILLSLLFIQSVWAGVDFNGDADYINMGTMPGFGSNMEQTFWVSCWINSSQATTFGLFGCVDTFTTTIPYFYIRINEAPNGTDDQQGYINTRLDRNSGGTDVIQGGLNFNSGITDGNWHSFVLWVDGRNDTLKIWIDGVSKTITYTQRSNEGDEDYNNFTEILAIGAINNNGAMEYFMDGEITEFAVGTGAITDAEVLNISLSYIKSIPLQTQISGIKLYLPLDEYPLTTGINGLTFNDLSGNGNTGTGVDADGDSAVVGESILSYPPRIGGWN